MLWNKCFIYCIIFTYWVIPFDIHRTVYVVGALNRDVMKVSVNEQKHPCYVCKNRTVEEAIKFHKFEDHYEGK